jgi:hypothetical protein
MTLKKGIKIQYHKTDCKPQKEHAPYTKYNAGFNNTDHNLVMAISIQKSITGTEY